MIQLYYDIDTARRVNENNAPLTTLLQFYYNTAPQVQFRFLSGGSPVDLSAINAWRAAIDTEFNASTVPVCRIENADIDASQAETGIVTVTFNCNSSEFLAKLNNNRNVNAWLDIYGINSNGQNEFIAQMPVILLAVVDPEQGDPAAVPPLYPSADAVRAMIAGTDAYELARNAEFRIGDRAYYPGEPGYLLICIAPGTSAAELPELDKTVNSFLDGTVTWQVYDLSESGGGAANITVNGVSPDAEGNIQLKAENISFNFKDDMGYDIPTSGAISTEDLQRFFTSMQYAIFSVNGYSAWENEPGIINGSIDIYGDTMFLESPESGTPMQDWYGNPLNTKSVYDLAYDVYTCCPRAIVINDGDMVGIDGEGVLYLYIRAEDVVVRQEWNSDIQEYNKTYLTDTLYELNYLKMGVPDYTSLEEDITRDTDHLANTSGWIIVNAQSDSAVALPIEVIIDEQTITKMSCETGNWQTVVVPVMEGTTWRVAVPNPGDSWIEWHIKFIPCTPLYNI